MHLGTSIREIETHSRILGHLWERDVVDSFEDEAMTEDNVESAPWTKTNTEVEEFILWRKDKAPEAQDPRISAIHNWIDISQAVNTGYNDNIMMVYLTLLLYSIIDTHLDSFTFFCFIFIIVDNIIFCIINTPHQ